MTRFTDGSKTIDITIREQRSGLIGADFSQDFFEVGGLVYNYDAQAYVVDDVDYLISYANDWAAFSGDFRDDDHEDDVERIVNVFER